MNNLPEKALKAVACAVLAAVAWKVLRGEPHPRVQEERKYQDRIKQNTREMMW
jgi:hypothetical protein